MCFVCHWLLQQLFRNWNNLKRKQGFEPTTFQYSRITRHYFINKKTIYLGSWHLPEFRVPSWRHATWTTARWWTATAAGCDPNRTGGGRGLPGCGRCLRPSSFAAASCRNRWTSQIVLSLSPLCYVSLCFVLFLRSNTVKMQNWIIFLETRNQIFCVINFRHALYSNFFD